MLAEVLYNLENGVEIALHRAQLWSKFAKDVINFIDKRTNICESSFTSAIYYLMLFSVQPVNRVLIDMKTLGKSIVLLTLENLLENATIEFQCIWLACLSSKNSQIKHIKASCRSV